MHVFLARVCLACLILGLNYGSRKTIAANQAYFVGPTHQPLLKNYSRWQTARPPQTVQTPSPMSALKFGQTPSSKLAPTLSVPVGWLLKRPRNVKHRPENGDRVTRQGERLRQEANICSIATASKCAKVLAYEEANAGYPQIIREDKP